MYECSRDSAAGYLVKYLDRYGKGGGDGGVTRSAPAPRLRDAAKKRAAPPATTVRPKDLDRQTRQHTRL